MARRSRDAAIDLGKPHNLSVGLIEALKCPEGKDQAFLRDTETKGLRVRVTAAGVKAFVFEAKVNGKTFRRTIGPVDVWNIGHARRRAKRLALLVSEKVDPRERDRAKAAEADRVDAEAKQRAAARAAEEAARAVLVRTAWSRYIEERRPFWGDRTYADHLAVAHPGGEKRKRMAGVTKPGPLAPLLSKRLVDLDAKAVEEWATREAKDRPARLRLSLRVLKAFLRWAADESDLKALVDPSAASARKAREVAGRAKPKDDVLQREQLKAWFGAVRAMPNQVTAAYLQALLIIGGRPTEVLSLKWSDINQQWRSITIRDKVEGERQVPLTPYVWSLLAVLPRRNEWVFSSVRQISQDAKHTKRRARYHAAKGSTAPEGDIAVASESGRLVDPGASHRQVCAAVGLGGLTLHGLRRSFASLTEWLEVPTGVVAQIQGHKPSATAEKHYKRRPLDLLRLHHERIEAWVLEQAGVAFEKLGVESPPLQAVAG
jgi:integrase